MFKSMNWATVKKRLPLFLIVYIPPLILLLVLGVIAGLTDIHVGDFFEDPAQLIGYDYYLGFIDSLGIVLWASAMAVCFFTFITLRRMGNNEDISKFVLFSGIFTLILLLDDLYLIHEWIGHFASEFILPLIMAIFYILILFRFRKVILKTDYIFLVIAIGCIAISFIFDTLQFIEHPLFQDGIRGLLEEGIEFLGIISWLTYFTRVCLRLLRSTAVT
jgi:hypothetical protein